MKSIALMMLASGTGAEALFGKNWVFRRSMYSRNGYTPVPTENVAGFYYFLKHSVKIEEKKAQEKNVFGISKSYVQYEVRIESKDFLENLETNNKALYEWMNPSENESFKFPDRDRKSLTFNTRYSFIKSWIEQAKLKTKKDYEEWAKKQVEPRSFVPFPPKNSFAKFYGKKKFLQERHSQLQKILENLLQDETVLEDFIFFHAEKNGYLVEVVVFDNNSYKLCGNLKVSQWNSFKKAIPSLFFKQTLLDNTSKEFEQTLLDNAVLEKFHSTLQRRQEEIGKTWLDVNSDNGPNHQAYLKQYVLLYVFAQLKSGSIDVLSLDTSIPETKKEREVKHDYEEARKFEMTLKKDVHKQIAAFLFQHGELLFPPQ